MGWRDKDDAMTEYDGLCWLGPRKLIVDLFIIRPTDDADAVLAGMEYLQRYDVGSDNE